MEMYKAIQVRPPFVDSLATGFQTCLIVREGTEYRGDVLLISSVGHSVGLVELYDVVRVEDMDDGDKIGSGYNGNRLAKAYGWCYRFRNARRVLELPCSARMVLTDVELDGLFEYPDITEDEVMELRRKYFDGLPEQKKAIRKLFYLGIGVTLLVLFVVFLLVYG